MGNRRQSAGGAITSGSVTGQAIGKPVRNRTRAPRVSVVVDDLDRPCGITDRPFKGHAHITHHLSVSGLIAYVNRLDVTPERLGDGRVSGFEIARNMLSALRSDGSFIDRQAVTQTLSEVFAILEGPRAEPAHGRSRVGAALSIQRAMIEMICFAAKHAPFDAWLDRQVADAEYYAKHCAELRAAKRAAFLERMAAARVAKSTQTALSTSEQHHA